MSWIAAECAAKLHTGVPSSTSERGRREREGEY